MKKVVVLCLVAVVVLLAAGAAMVYWQRLAPPAIRPDALLPADTLLLVEAVDLPRSALRWRGTELYKLWTEPEVQAFLEKPLASYPPLQKSAATQKQVVKLWPRQAFASVVSMDGGTPKMIAGFSFAGDGKVAEQWLAEPRGRLKTAHPAGKAELILHGKVEIVTYTDQDFVLAEATHKGWHLAANDLSLLRQTLDRLDAKKNASPPALAGDADYQKTFSVLPGEADWRVFARTGPFADRLQAAVAAGDPGKKTGLEGLREIRALAAVSKIEGALFHDAVYALSEHSAPAEPLARGALELTTPETTSFYSTQLGALGLSALPPEMRGAIPFVASLEAALKAQGSTLDDLPAIFGPELSVLLPKSKGPVVPVIAVSLRDPQRAAQLAEALAAPALGDQAWTAEEEDGLWIFTAPAADFVLPVTPVLTVTDHYWLLSTTPASFAALTSILPGTPQIDHTAAWRELAEGIVAPTQSFGYFNLGSFLESYYGTARSALALGLVGSEETGQYFDAGKLPGVTTLARHLGGIVTSQAAVPGGTLWESRGNFSIGQTGLAAAAIFQLSGGELPAIPKLLKSPATPKGTVEPPIPNR